MNHAKIDGDVVPSIEFTHAFTNDVLADHDAVAVAELVRTDELSSEHVVEAAIARAKSVENKIHAIVCECFGSAVEKARTPVKGAFQGVPTVIKDMNNVPGLTTRFGTNALRNVKPATKTDPFVQELFSMGMICLLYTSPSPRDATLSRMPSSA